MYPLPLSAADRTPDERVMGVTQRRQEFWRGARESVPLLIGAAPFALIFGALAITSGLSPLATLALSVCVFAGSAQFVAVGLVATGVSVPWIILTTLIVNLRHALYSLTLGLYVQRLPQRWLIPLGFWLTDETFAVTSLHYRNHPSPFMHWYQLGSSVAMHLNWVAWTALGVLAEHQMAHPAQWGLQFAAAVTFIGLIVPTVRNRPTAIAVLASGGMAIVTYGLPDRLFLLASALAGIAAGLAAEAVLPAASVSNSATDAR